MKKCQHCGHECQNWFAACPRCRQLFDLKHRPGTLAALSTAGGGMSRSPLVAAGRRSAGNQKIPPMAWIALVSSLFCGGMIGVPLGDASLNPARSFGPAMFEQGAALTEFFNVYIWAPIVGAVAGLILYRIMRMSPPIEEDEEFADDF